MRKLRPLLAVLAVAASACNAPGDSRGGDGDADSDSDWSNLPDADGDTIADADEGRSGAASADSDGDGNPDYLDADSDNDGIPDRDEAGDGDADTPPSDTDEDGADDFRDLDSDGNEILDEDEGTDDVDGDGRGNWRDTDDDGDAIFDTDEIGDDPSSPIDSDGDGTPDFRDVDSDDDTILDHDERADDVDGDGTKNYLDRDSDDDGWTDAEEAGDADLQTEPVDTDADRIDDYLDPDSDNDGLSDAAERKAGTLRDDADSDDDGVTDLVEQAAGTDPLDAASNPGALGDFVFLEPYEEDPTPAQDTLAFSTSIQQADVYFLVDTTGSMGGEINNLSADLDGFLIPSVEGEIPDVWFGVGHHDDYPICDDGGGFFGGGGDCYGTAGDEAFAQLQRMTGVAADARAAARALSLGNGADGPESQVPALHAIATGDGDGAYIGDGPACGAGEVGYPCFRAGAVPIVVLFTDITFHNGPGGSDPYDDGLLGIGAPTYAETVDVLTAAGIRVIGVNSGIARSQLESLARDTGAVDAGGNELVYDIAADGSGLGDAVVDGIATLANDVPIDITAEPRDDPADGVDATRFIERVVPNVDGDAGLGCEGGLTTADTDGDGFEDTFVDVLPGTGVCFDIVPTTNDFLPPTEEPQLFRATVVVVGDGITDLDERDVFFLVPPEIGDPGGPD